MHRPSTNLSRQDGAALIVAMWVVALMAIMVSSFAFDMHVEAKVLSYYKKRMQATHLAKAGVERARMLLIKSVELKDQLSGLEDPSEHEDSATSWFDSAKGLSEGVPVMAAISILGRGEVVLTIIPEEARRNVNRLTEEDWERIFEVTAIPEEEWEVMIDSYLDWIDADETDRLSGAESEYYEELEPSYVSKNAALDTVDELLLVRGFTRGILYGLPPEDQEDAEDWIPPLVPMHELLTVYGDPQGRVNVNAASLEVLMTLPGMDDLMATEIISERNGEFLGDIEQPEAEDTSFESVADFNSRFPEIGQAVSGKITTSASLYRIVSVGRLKGVEHTVSCIVSFSKGEMEILRWSESDVL